MRHGRMAAPALDDDVELVDRSHDRAVANAELADLDAWHVVHAEDLGDAERSMIPSWTILWPPSAPSSAG